MAQRPRTGTQTVDAWLEEQRAHRAPGARLPTDTALASQFNLSRKTVERVMRAHAQRGELVRVRRKGTFLASAPTESLPAPSAPQSAPETLAAYLTDALVRGRFVPGNPFPGTKYLVHEYHVSRSTAVAACRLLTERGLLDKIGKRFWCRGVPAARRHDTRPEILVFADSSAALRSLFDDRAYGTAYRTMEDVLAVHGYTVRYELRDRLSDRVRRWSRTRMRPHAILFADLGAGTEFDREPVFGRAGIGPLLGQCRVVADLRGQATRQRDPATTLHVKRSQVTFLFRPYLSRMLHEEFTRFAAARRFRAVTFITSAHPAAHNETAASRPRAGLSPFWTVRDIAHVCELLRQHGRATDQHIILLGDDGARANACEQAGATLRAVGALHVNLHGASSFAEALRAAPEGLIALRTDTMAAQALECLAARGETVPGRHAVLTLDNDPSFYHLGISRIEIDWYGLGHLLAHALMGDIAVPRTPEGYLRAEARVVEKRTT
jgi:DNA-binding transcriptional regulator YhcF (GntR family)